MTRELRELTEATRELLLEARQIARNPAPAWPKTSVELHEGIERRVELALYDADEALDEALGAAS